MNDESANYPSLGSVSEGTLRNCDLIPIFFDLLDSLDPSEANRIANAYVGDMLGWLYDLSLSRDSDAMKLN